MIRAHVKKKMSTEIEIMVGGRKYRRVLKKQKRGPGFTCIFCEKYFSGTSSNKNDHIRRHIHEKPFNCHLCDFTGAAATDVTTHVNRFHGPKNVPCLELGCMKMFRSEYALKIHHKTNHFKSSTGGGSGEGCGDKWTCDICGKKFKQKGSLISHNRIHSGEKPFQCQVCDKNFTQKSALTTHLRIHTGEKRFQCETCEKKFMTKHGLQSHQTRENCLPPAKPQSCKICGAEFIVKQHLKDHWKMIHPGASYSQVMGSGGVIGQNLANQGEQSGTSKGTKNVVILRSSRQKQYTIQVTYHESAN